MSRLSIITVCLNNKEGLAKTLQSIFHQSFKDYEIILIDGGSTDGSVDLIRSYNEKIKYWISEKDNGVYHAMNKGIMKANGEYCLFLNSGDSLTNNEILQYVFSKEPEADIIYGNLIRQKGAKKYRINRYPDKLTLYHFYAPVASLHHQASFIKRTLFDQYGLYREDLKIVADWEFFFRLIILNNCKTRHINKNISIFDSGGMSSGGRNSEQHLKDKILREHIPSRILSDYERFTRDNKNWQEKLRGNLSKYSFMNNAVRILYRPYIRLKEYLNYYKTIRK